MRLAIDILAVIGALSIVLAVLLGRHQIRYSFGRLVYEVLVVVLFYDLAKVRTHPWLSVKRLLIHALLLPISLLDYGIGYHANSSKWSLDLDCDGRVKWHRRTSETETP